MELAIDLRYQGYLRDVEMLSNFKSKLFELYSKWHHSRINELEEMDKQQMTKDRVRNSKLKSKKEEVAKPNKIVTKSEMR